MRKPSIAVLKGYNDSSEVMTSALARWRVDKGYSTQIFDYWHLSLGSISLETLLGRFLLRLPDEMFSRRLLSSIVASQNTSVLPTYQGTYQENLEIDRAIADSVNTSLGRDHIRRGAASSFSLQDFRVPSWAGTSLPIIILGGGAAGILAGRTLLNAGYANLTIVDTSAAYGGIWKHRGVQLARNNPVAFNYEEERVEAAPGTGLAIMRFLDQVAFPPPHTGMKPLPSMTQGTVIRVDPGDLAHRVLYRDRQGKICDLLTPLLINALGLGEPLPLSRPGVIETDVVDQQGGIRWQHELSREEAEQLRGKTVVFVGLGNSTLEMVVQVQRLNEQGFNISYKILTHYSRQALSCPTSPDKQGRQLYRDLASPHLTRLAGDLEYIHRAFQRAWKENETGQEEIIPDVMSWNVEQRGGDQWMRIKTREQREECLPFHRLYTLIGYGHSSQERQNLGLTTWTETIPARIAHDYDGEIQKQVNQTGRDRLFPGYFGFGSILSAPNAQVIPGMLYRLPDLLVGITMRATEYVLKQREKRYKPGN